MDERVAFVASSLADLGDPDRARAMAAYMKTDMPFFGVPAPLRWTVFRGMRRRFPIEGEKEYVEAVLALWARPHREEKYFAIELAKAHPEYITFVNVPLYRRLIVEGAWWDLVDDVAAHCIGTVLLHERHEMKPVLDQWVDDPDMWLRRSALIAHLRHKGRTDQDQLFDHCLRRAFEKEFFIRKAIGWALREYAKTAPEAVAEFLIAHRDQWAGLTYREASKHLDL